LLYFTSYFSQNSILLYFTSYFCQNSILLYFISYLCQNSILLYFISYFCQNSILLFEGRFNTLYNAPIQRMKLENLFCCWQYLSQRGRLSKSLGMLLF